MRTLRDDAEGGFTLVELVLVLLLLGFMALLSFPNFRELISPGDLKRAVLGFVGTLRYAQSQAATVKQSYRVNMDIGENAFWVSLEAERGKFSRDPSSYGQLTHLPTGIIFLDVYQPERGKARDGDAYVEFSATGWAEECTIHLKKSEQQVFTLFVHSLGGNVEVVEGYIERLKE